MTSLAMQRPGEEAQGRNAPSRERASTSRVAQRQQPQRRCIATGEIRPQKSLLRFVVAPDGSLIADISGKLPGRGLWLTPTRSALEKARARNLFARAARCPVTLPDDLAAQVTKGLRRRCLELLGLANRSGLVVRGFEKCKALLAGGQAGVLLQASDAADDGRDRLAALGKAVRPELMLFRPLSAAELGQAVGREHVVHVAVKPGPLTERLSADLSRLQGMLGQNDNQTDGAPDRLARRGT